MTFLILKIFMYLLVALGLGGGAGWVVRQIAAQRELEVLNKQLNENKARVPQLESLARAREKQLARVQEQQQEQQELMQQATEQTQTHERLVREKEVEISRLKARLKTTQSLSDAIDGEMGDNNELVLASANQTSVPVPVPDVVSKVDNETVRLMRDQIRKLEVELSDARYQLEAGQSGDGLRSEVDELTARLRQKAQDHDRLNRQLDKERRKVQELERERDLQNRSIQVMHQQLELGRSSAPPTEASAIPTPVAATPSS